MLRYAPIATKAIKPKAITYLIVDLNLIKGLVCIIS